MAISRRRSVRERPPPIHAQSDETSAAESRSPRDSRIGCLNLLRCPRTGLPLRQIDPQTLVTATSDVDRQHRYVVVGGLPVLIDFERSVVDESDTLARAAASSIRRTTYRGLAGLAKRLVSPTSSQTVQNVARFITRLKEAAPRPVVLVVGGGTIGQGMDALYRDPGIHLIAFDIYGSSEVQFIADGHRIPLADASCDGVVIQAVLEHVLEPQLVVAEIHRVLKPRGLVYAETPFMQQVHEGAFDFTRFTESGHRYLFARFDLIDLGVTAGAGSQLLWSLDYFVRGLFRSRGAGKATKLLFFWLRYLDPLIPRAYSIDAASGVFFLGRRAERAIGPKEAVAHYQGAQR